MLCWKERLISSLLCSMLHVIQTAKLDLWNTNSSVMLLRLYDEISVLLRLDFAFVRLCGWLQIIGWVGRHSSFYLRTHTQRKTFHYIEIYLYLRFLPHRCNFIIFMILHRDTHRQNPECCIRGADKSLARPTSRCILFDGENISFDVSLVIYINSINIPPIMIINRIYETQNLLSL